MDKTVIFGIVVIVVLMLFFLSWIGYATSKDNDKFAAAMLIEATILIALFVFILPTLLGYLG